MVRRSNLLLVEDDQAVREALTRVLMAENYDVFSATSCREAIHLGTQRKIDVVLLDLNLGEEDGWEAFRVLKENRPELPIIVVSGEAERFSHASASLASGALEKPFDPVRLISLLLDTIKPAEPTVKLPAVKLAMLAGLFLGASVFQANATTTGPELNLVVRDGMASLSWDGTGTYQVQTAPAPQGPWTDLGAPTSANALTAATVWPSAFYRLKAVNPVLGAPVGQYQWAKDMRGHTATDLAHVNALAVDSQGNSIVAGEFSGTINFGGVNLTSAGGSDIFVAKYSTTGNLVWAKRYGDIYNQSAYGVAVDSANNIILVGSFAGTITFGGALLTEVPTPSFYYSQTDIFVAKLNADGGHVWSRSYGSSGAEAAYGVAVDPADDVVLTGNYGIPPNSSQLNFGGGVLPNSGAQDVFVTKLAGRDGSYRWAVHHGSSDGTFAYAVYATGISADGNGDVAVVGYFTGGTVDLGGGNRASAGGSDLFVAKYSGASGAHIWSKTVGGAGSEIARAVTTDSRNDVIVTGGFNGTVDFGGLSLTAPQATGIFVSKYSADGRQLVWAKAFGGNFTAEDMGYAVAADGNGNIGLTGTVRGSYIDFGGGPLYGDGTLNIFVAKLSGNGDYAWAKRLKTGATLNYGLAAGFDSSGSLLAGGYFGGTVDFGGGTLVANVSLQDGFLVKYGP